MGSSETYFAEAFCWDISR
jgi:hypothetical protein